MGLGSNAARTSWSAFPIYCPFQRCLTGAGEAESHLAQRRNSVFSVLVCMSDFLHHTSGKVQPYH